MKATIQNNTLIIKTLFREQHYPFNELTRVVWKGGVFIYKGEKCIYQEKRFLKYLPIIDEIEHLAMKYGLIYETTKMFEDEIPIEEIHSYGKKVCEELQMTMQEYVTAELGREYEAVVTMKEGAYRVDLYGNIFQNGAKVCMNNEEEVTFYTHIDENWKDFQLWWTELVVPEYINPREQKFRINKKVDFTEDIIEIKEQIKKMKECGIVPVSHFSLPAKVNKKESC